ncbi:MAG TPA: TlyA family RNA methyltransferase [Anaerolineae bacterium]|nr:TlyA family RNA methyltransferase [Anaerolineae bacterium]HQK14032.1 TlyA family RNA methyltransferase [Anaerolineae bacterium]
MEKQRLDVLLVERGLAESRSLAQRLIHAGEVLVEGQLADKPGVSVPVDADLRLKSRPRFVSRGGEKLAAALARFPVTVSGKVAADIGASTGGFTDCLLQHGAAKVYAIDVGYGQLAWELRQDARVVVLERINARYLTALPEPVDLIVSDVSFISLRLIYATAVRWLKPDGAVISLIKPQFEAGRADVGKGGVVRDPAVHRRVLETVTADMAALGLGLRGLMVSPLLGPAGNVEFLGWWEAGAISGDTQTWIDQTLDEVRTFKR